ncbi:MAG: glycosyltransferase [Synergistaceae bacterium]|nr:glycosyltransferase [Synergistaceae bacterium]
MAFFCYNRPEHTRKTLEALKANYLAPGSRLFIFSDGPKDDAALEGVRKVREYIATVDGFASVEIIEREKNYGCSGNIIDGITQVVNEFGRVIVVEDDILTSPWFLRYVNDALELYKDDDNVAIISGYLHPRYLRAYKDMPQSFFMRVPMIWGWGTWQRSWKDYEYDAGKLLEQIRAQGREDEYNYCLKNKPRTRNLQAQADGKVGTWDYQLDASMFLKRRLSLCPGRTFTNNIGHDGTGIHCGIADYDSVNVKLSDEYEPLRKIPVELDEKVYEVHRKSLIPPSLPYRAVRKLWRIITGKNRKSVKVSKG